MLSEVKVPKEMRWSHWTQFKAEEALSHFKKEVFPNLSKLADEDNSLGEYMKTAECKINKPSLLVEAVNLLDQMEISQQNQDVQGDASVWLSASLYEYMLGSMKFAPCASLRGSATGVVARVEALRGRMSEGERQASCRVYRDIEELSPEGDASQFESLLSESFGEDVL